MKRMKRVKLRGSKTCGRGSKKKHRGKGSRGGKGRAGTFKHKKVLRLKSEPWIIYGKKGFKSLRKRGLEEEVKAINLQELVKLGEKEIDVIKLGYQKVLGKGKVEKPLVVKAKSFSEVAKRKLEEAGGKAIEV